jgi:hypothetical protein
MKKTLATILCLSVVLLCGGANYYRQMLMLPRAAVASSQYQTDPYAANLIARWDFDNDTAWTNDVTANAQHLAIAGTASAISNVVVGTNQYGRIEKAAFFNANPVLRHIITPAEQAIWSNSESVVSYWLYRSRTNVQDFVYAFGSTNAIDDGFYHIFNANTHALYEFVRSNAVSLANDGYPSSLNVTLGEWVHIVEMRSRTKGSRMWRNGVIHGTASTASEVRLYSWGDEIKRENIAGRNPAIAFGAGASRYQYMQGYIDNARAYNVSTATNNVSWLYANTHPTNCLELR